MTKLETNRTRIVSRLISEGWLSEGGAKHEKFYHPERPGNKIMVPRHKDMTYGVAKSIARAANW